MKKLVSLLLSVVLVLSITTTAVISASAEILTQGEYQITYNVNKKGKPISVNIVGYKGSESKTTVSVPAEINELPVVSIRYCTFRDFAKIKSITIPSTVTELDYGVFYGCSSLETVNMPDSVKSLGDFCFAYCTSLKSLKLSKNISVIPENCFFGCTGFTSFTIPDSVTLIEDSAFADCFNLQSVNLGSGLEDVGNLVFFNCTSLNTVTFGNKLKAIRYMMFKKCAALTSIKIPNSVKSIDFGAFQECSHLTTVYIPNSIKQIDFDAFDSCPKLANVYYNGSISELQKIEIGKENDSFINAQFYYLQSGKYVPITKGSITLKQITNNIFFNMKVDLSKVLKKTLSANDVYNVVDTSGNMQTVKADSNNEFIVSELKANKTYFVSPTDDTAAYELNKEEASFYLNDEGELTVSSEVRGDINTDKTFNIVDVTYFQKSLVKSVDYIPTVDKTDFNGDEIINIRDATRMQQLLVQS